MPVQFHIAATTAHLFLLHGAHIVQNLLHALRTATGVQLGGKLTVLHTKERTMPVSYEAHFARNINANSPARFRRATSARPSRARPPNPPGTGSAASYGPDIRGQIDGFARAWLSCQRVRWPPCVPACVRVCRPLCAPAKHTDAHDFLLVLLG